MRARRSNRPAVLLGLSLVGFLPGVGACRQPGLPGCTALLEAKDYAGAASRCEEVYRREGEPHAGAAAARAQYHLGHPQQVFGWVKRLAGTAGEPGLWSLTASIHWQRGELALAERDFRHDLALTRRAGDAKAMSGALYGLFYLAWADSRYREALRFASEAFTTAARAGDREAQARAAEGLYTVLYDVGDRAGARRALEMAASLRREQSPLERARFLVNEGLLLKAEGRPTLGAMRLEEAVKLAAGGDDRTLRSAHLDLVEAYLDAGQVEQAERHLQAARAHAEASASPTALLYYQAAVELARHHLDAAAATVARALAGEPVPEWAWDLEQLAGRVAEARGDPAAAEAAYERSTRVIEGMRRELELGELQSWLLERKRRPFESLFLLQARGGRAVAALATAERAQARTLLDAFIQAASASQQVATDQAPEGAADRLEALRALLPAMGASAVAAPQPIERVLAAFGDRHGLAYFEAGAEDWLLTVHGGRVRALRLARPRREIRDLAERLQARPDDRALAASLGDLLLPAGALPAAGAPLYVVADGALAQVAFAALRHGDRYLVEEHPVVYVPSLTALVAIAARPGVPYGPALVLADPRADLPAAAAEALAVGPLLHATVRTAQRATTGELASGARASLLHLATHSGLGPRGPWLRLADRDFGAGEIVGRRIAPRLVVLASCASAARERREMWGSLAAAFLAAGSRSVLASLRSVDDAVARDFVLRFYREGGAADPVAGLARAQRAAIARGEPPASWAPFALFGAELER
ncbi:MAG TPA: CHAT domain-containing protein [Thermoanaerobaculia bacterium]|nr:CHAT domain-containing protein [Thermoanaerobaculia bacterium]